MREGQEFSPDERDALREQARERRNGGSPRLPSLAKLAVNATKAVVKHTLDGQRQVELPRYQQRLNICNDCLPPNGFRVKNRCTHESFGCFLDKKAWWASEECPLGKW